MSPARHQKARDSMADDAIRNRAEEANMVRLARGDATQVLAGVARLLPGLQKWAKKAQELLDGSDPKSATEALKIMGQVATIVDKTAGAADKIMAMERRLLGQPESIIGVAMPELTLDEALAHIDATDRTLARAKQLGLIPKYVGQAKVIEVDAEAADVPADEHSAPMLDA